MNLKDPDFVKVGFMVVVVVDEFEVPATLVPNDNAADCYTLECALNRRGCLLTVFDTRKQARDAIRYTRLYNELFETGNEDWKSMQIWPVERLVIGEGGKK